MFKFLPDATISWRDAFIGGAVTAVLFELGKFVLGLYLGRKNPGSAFGAASALAVILVWIYYAGILVLFGAEFTQHYAEARGRGVRPKKGAVKIEQTERIVPESNTATRTATTTRGEARMRENGNGNASARPVALIPARTTPTTADASLGELLKSLSSDSSHLVQQEIALAKTELKESAAKAGRAAGKLGVAALLALPGILAITAALIIGLGILIHSYWGSALIVGAVILVVAGVMAKRAAASLSSGLKPEQTIETVQDDVAWAKEEMPRVKQRLTA